jgi:hypothetical protein
MNGVETFRFSFRQTDEPHGTNLESRLLDALKDLAGEPSSDRVRFDDGQRPFHIR